MQAVQRIALVSSLVTACSLAMAQDAQPVEAPSTTDAVSTQVAQNEPIKQRVVLRWRESDEVRSPVAASVGEMPMLGSGSHTPDSEAWAAGGAIILASASLLVRRVLRTP